MIKRTAQTIVVQKVPAPTTKMQIFVRTLIGRTILIRTEHPINVEALKSRIYDKEGIPDYLQRLTRNGKPLANDLVLWSPNKSHWPTIHMDLNLDGGSPIIRQNPTGTRNTPAMSKQIPSLPTHIPRPPAKTGPERDTHTAPDEVISHLWKLSSAVLRPVLHALQDWLLKTDDPIVLYKGLQTPNNRAMEETIKEISRNLPRTWVWTSSLETAINEATPNKGLKGRLSLIERRLLRKGHSDLVTNHTGIVLSYKTIAIPI